MTQTLFSMIDRISVKRYRLSRSLNDQGYYTRDWSVEDSSHFFQIMDVYGADYSILQNCFPHKSRKQLKRKYEQLQELKNRLEHRNNLRRQQQRRKSFFDTDILQCEQIQWLNKPNNNESSSSQDN